MAFPQNNFTSRMACDVPSGDIDALFMVYYNVTTVAEIDAALADNKVPYFDYGGNIAQLWKTEPNKYTFRTTATRTVDSALLLDIVDYIVEGQPSVWSTRVQTIDGDGSGSQQAYLRKLTSFTDFDTTGLSGMYTVLPVNNVPNDGVYQVSVMMSITPKIASPTKSDLVFGFYNSDGIGMPDHTFHAVVDDSQTFAQQLSFSTTLNLKAGTNTLKMACGGLNTEYLVFVDDLTVAQLVNGVYHNGDNFNEVHTLTQASDFNNDDGVLVDGATGGPRFMLWQTLANKVLGFIKSLSTTITAFRTGDVIPVDGPSGTAKMTKDNLITQVRGDIVAPLFRTDKTYYPDMVCVKDGISYVCIAEHTGAWDAADFVAKGVSSFVEDAVKFCQANILSIPFINIPKISISSAGVITITFPETTGQGVDSNAFYVFKGNARSLKIDYSSNLSSGKYEVTLNNNKALVYDYRTNAFRILTTYNTQYNGNIYLICANINGRILGPLSDYYYTQQNNSVAERLDAVLDTSSRYKYFVNVGQVLLDGSVGDVQDWNRYSDFIAVKKGDIVIAHTCTGTGSSAIAFYTSPDFSTFVCGVAGVVTNPFKDYVFICPSDGYVVSSTSKYSLSSGLNGYVDVFKNRKGITFQNPEVPRFDLLNYTHLTKQGVVLDIGESGDYDDKFVESPSIFYEPSLQKLVMLYTAYKVVDLSTVACIAYATSDDGITWTKQGIFWERTNVVGTPDRGGVTGPVMVKDGGKYYLFYIGLTNAGYEGGNKTICCAVGTSLSDFTGGTATRKGAQIIPNGTGWYGSAVWHTSFIHKDDIWYCFFNATASSPSYERIGVACSKSLNGPWSVVSVNLLDYINDEDTTIKQKAIDPSVVKVGSYYIMAYGAGNAEGKVQDNWAYTTDEDFPYGWKFGGVGVVPSETYDNRFAHKPFLLCIENKIYHYYTALNNSNHRCIALIK